MAEDTSPEPRTGQMADDDIVLPFRTSRSGVIGRLVRLGSAVDTILSHHDVPEPVLQTLGEAVALTALLGTSLKFDGKLILQTKTDGIVDFIVVNFEAPGRVRGYVRCDKARFAASAADGGPDEGALLGTGHLAITIDPGEDMERYQGIVELTGSGLADAALNYFRQSEQLPTFIRLALARHYQAGSGGEPGSWQWRAGGLMIQNLALAGGRSSTPMSEEDEELGLLGEDDDDWERTCILASTVEDHELLDPTLQPERLLYRLFHEEGVRALPATPIEAYCRCSRERVAAFLKSFGAEDLADMREPDGGISVTCEFCSQTYRFAPGEIA
jgi:molecular chaperone Hsp33